MKLQKLLFYTYVWTLVAGKKIFKANFEAWEYGPVEPEIYQKYKSFGKGVIPAESVKTDNIPQEVDFILDSYANFSAIELSKTTHMEQPWKKFVGKKTVIPDEEIVSFYKKQPFSKNFPISESKVYYPPKTASHYVFTFDMDKDFVPVYNNLQEFVDRMKKAHEDWNSFQFQ